MILSTVIVTGSISTGGIPLLKSACRARVKCGEKVELSNGISAFASSYRRCFTRAARGAESSILPQTMLSRNVPRWSYVIEKGENATAPHNRGYDAEANGMVLCQDFGQNKVRNFRVSRGSGDCYAGALPQTKRFIAITPGA